MSDGRILYAEQGNVCVLKFIGAIKLHNSLILDELCLQSVISAHAQQIIFDMRETEYLDSTALGSLASFAGCVAKELKLRPSAVVNDETLESLLFSVRLDKVMDISQFVDLEFDESAITQIDAPGEETERDMAIRSLKAHQALIDWSEDNAVQFKSVVECLESELKDS